MVSPDQKTLDPYLVLTDGTGKSLAEDDDSGGGLNARIVFRPEQAGTFRILATSINFGAGAFTLTVRETANAPQKRSNNGCTATSMRRSRTLDWLYAGHSDKRSGWLARGKGAGETWKPGRRAAGTSIAATRRSK